jgi:hypothetical protein
MQVCQGVDQPNGVGHPLAGPPHRRPAGGRQARWVAGARRCWPGSGPRSWTSSRPEGIVDRSHRKLAHPGSRLQLVHVSESRVRRVLGAEGPCPGRETGPRAGPEDAVAGWLEWLEWNRTGSGPASDTDFTHVTWARRAVVAVLDIGLPQVADHRLLGRGDLHPGQVAFTAAAPREACLGSADVVGCPRTMSDCPNTPRPWSSGP